MTGPGNTVFTDPIVLSDFDVNVTDDFYSVPGNVHQGRWINPIGILKIFPVAFSFSLFLFLII